ncbi:MAG: GNAT family N-acetyltransferase [Oscillospiraceae bacterium]|nr:GNAT family N-acetyltransferase [Oscillospiraceae bacterium]
MDNQELRFLLLTRETLPLAREIDRTDIPGDYVDDLDTIMELTQYGLDHNCKGHTYLIVRHGRCIGLILLGEAILWATDPEEMRQQPFYRLMDFVLDRTVRGMGLGSLILEETIRRIYEQYGPRPIALGIHRNNAGAVRFYLRHGFRPADATEGKDRYYLRYPDDPC